MSGSVVQHGFGCLQMQEGKPRKGAAQQVFSVKMSRILRAAGAMSHAGPFAGAVIGGAKLAEYLRHHVNGFGRIIPSVNTRLYQIQCHTPSRNPTCRLAPCQVREIQRDDLPALLRQPHAVAPLAIGHARGASTVISPRKNA